jgi:phospholipid/cholesterol/gamma-HCH transport system substrate-binding protein
MRMKSKVKPFLKVDALASIGVDGLMGDKLITIASGSANEIKLLNRGSQIMTVNPVDFDKVISRFTNVATNAEIITHELAGMAVQIREGKSTIGRLLYTDNLSKSLENTASNAESITSSLAGIASEIKSGKGSVGKLIYTDSLSDGLASVVTTANKSMLTIQEAADGFSENMKALHGNYFLRGYFKRKVRDEANKANNPQADTLNGIDTGMTEAELKDIITDAQNALKAKQEKK